MVHETSYYELNENDIKNLGLIPEQGRKYEIYITEDEVSDLYRIDEKGLGDKLVLKFREITEEQMDYIIDNCDNYEISYDDSDDKEKMYYDMTHIKSYVVKSQNKKLGVIDNV